MAYTQEILKLYHDMVHGGSIAGVSYKDVLEDLSWEEATVKLGDSNSIATLVQHVQYYVRLVSRVLNGGVIEGNDALSFQHPAITCKADWEQLLLQTWKECDAFEALLKGLTDEVLMQPFEAYGTYYRNIHGIIEHTHYHLGQMNLLKKLIRTSQ